MSEFMEKRESTRLSFEAPVTLTLADTTAVVEGSCVNMSSTGILIDIAIPVAVDARLDINLRDDPKAFSASGQVVRLIEDGERFLAAIKFDTKN